MDGVVDPALRELTVDTFICKKKPKTKKKTPAQLAALQLASAALCL